METLQSGTWSAVSEAFLSNTAGISGVVGDLQDTTLAEDQMIIGGSAPYVDAAVLLWNGGSLEGGIGGDDGGELDGGTEGGSGDAGASSAPPLVSITSPAPNASISGAVTIRASASSANGIASVAFYVQGTHQCTTFAPPFLCVSNTGQWADAGSTGVDLEAVATDDLGNWSQADVVVNIPSAMPPDDGGSTDAGGTVDAGGSLDGGGPDATAMQDAGGPHPDASAMDASRGGDASMTSDGGGNAGSGSGSSGCQCELASRPAPPGRSMPLVLLGLLGIAVARRRGDRVTSS
jgi:MYXO-CTERM domain-containing protein